MGGRGRDSSQGGGEESSYQGPFGVATPFPVRGSGRLRFVRGGPEPSGEKRGSRVCHLISLSPTSFFLEKSQSPWSQVRVDVVESRYPRIRSPDWSHKDRYFIPVAMYEVSRRPY